MATSEEIVVRYSGPDGMEFGHFKRTHGSQLSRVPAIYWETLHRKLKCEVGGLAVVQLAGETASSG